MTFLRNLKTNMELGSVPKCSKLATLSYSSPKTVLGHILCL